MRKKLTIQEAKKIADRYCTEVSKFRKAVYGGQLNGGHLFSLDFQGSGHHGTPIFVIVKNNSKVEHLEQESDLFYKAWHSSNNYLDSLKGSNT